MQRRQSIHVDGPIAAPRGRGEWLTRRGKWLIILPPLLFLLVFFLIPFGFALVISFADTAVRVPPFTDILSISPDWHIHLTLNLGNFKYLFTDEVYGLSYMYSLKTAFFSTLICLAIGYPDGLRHRPHLEEHAEHPAAHHHFAVLDLVPAARLCARGHHPRDRPAQLRRCSGSGSSTIRCRSCTPPSRCISASSTPICRSWCCRCSRRWRSWITPCSRPPADLGSPPWRAFLDVTLPLVHARHHRRLHAGVHPRDRRVRHPDAARRARQSHDRPRAVGRVLRQSRLAGRLRGRHRVPGAAGRARSPSTSTTAPSSSRPRAWRTASRRS